MSELQRGAIERKPEEPGLYESQSEVDAYTSESAKLEMRFIERRYADHVAATYGLNSRLRVLELGSGPAWIPTMLSKKCPSWEINCLDLSSLMLKGAVQRQREQGASLSFMRASAQSVPLADSSIDLVISHFAFSEFPEPDRVLAEMARVLAPGGAFCIQDLMRPHKALFPLLIGWRYLTKPFSKMSRQYVESLRGAYTEAELVGLFKEAGLPCETTVFARAAGGIMRVSGQVSAS